MLVGSDQNTPLLRKGDMLIITSLDRLGRNYTEIHQQWGRITKEIGADIRVLDMPLLDTTAGDGSLDQRFIADLVLQILSYVSEKERLSIKARQRQGIEAHKTRDQERKAQGLQAETYKGRQAISVDEEEMRKQCKAWREGKQTATEAMKKLGLKPNTFYRRVKEKGL